MKRTVLFALMLLVVTPALSLAGTWNIDPSHSSVGFKVRHFFSKVPGQFTEFSGTIEFDAENPKKSVVDVTINPASANTNNEKRDGHLMSEDFFWVEKHPQMTFKSSKVKALGDDAYAIEGDLTMRGVTKKVTLDAEFLGSGPDGWGGSRAGFTATTKVDRKDFGINWNKALDKGGAVLGDEVWITLEIEAVLAEEKAGE